MLILVVIANLGYGSRLHLRRREIYPRRNTPLAKYASRDTPPSGLFDTYSRYRIKYFSPLAGYISIVFLPYFMK
ncbi:hypothetical protein [Algoriphagus formosus]|uniref:Uncharacterized protein n=1 Tax=Algoriphagus formosus TaxID=2007308 RepID=A0A4R5V8E4_9BACT|nr:hypothetical protein [Algoriphagus aquimaris]TDK48244.1 hypothetical protein E1898_04300 [Algoriphagus aquimaris]